MPLKTKKQLWLENNRERVRASKRAYYLKKKDSPEFKLKHCNQQKAYYERLQAERIAKGICTGVRKRNSKFVKHVYNMSTQELRQHIIDLYSHGTGKCLRCGGKVEHLHHTNPEDGKWEMSKFGSISTRSARVNQVDMYTVISDYITPLCKACHCKLHKELRRPV